MSDKPKTFADDILEDVECGMDCEAIFTEELCVRLKDAIRELREIAIDMHGRESKRIRDFADSLEAFPPFPCYEKKTPQDF